MTVHNSVLERRLFKTLGRNSLDVVDKLRNNKERNTGYVNYLNRVNSRNLYFGCYPELYPKRSDRNGMVSLRNIGIDLNSQIRQSVGRYMNCTKLSKWGALSRHFIHNNNNNGKIPTFSTPRFYFLEGVPTVEIFTTSILNLGELSITWMDSPPTTILFRIRRNLSMILTSPHDVLQPSRRPFRNL